MSSARLEQALLDPLSRTEHDEIVDGGRAVEDNHASVSRARRMISADDPVATRPRRRIRALSSSRVGRLASRSAIRSRYSESVKPDCAARTFSLR